MPFSHSASLSKTCFSFNSFSLASENSLILPCLSLQMVLACSGMSKSEPSDSGFSSGEESRTLLFSFSFFFFSFFSFFFSILSPSLLLFRYSSITAISTPSIFRAVTNSSTSSPFFNPKAFRRPLVTVLLFFPSSSPFLFDLAAGSSSSESSTLLFPLTDSDAESEDKLLLRSIYSLSLMMSPSLPLLSLLAFASPRYFFSSLAFRSAILQYLTMTEQNVHLNDFELIPLHPSQNNSERAEEYGEQQFCCPEERERDSLIEKIEQLKVGIEEREVEVVELKNRIKFLQEMGKQRKILSEREKRLESQLQDLQQFEEKIQKEMKLLLQEEQIKKGKVIIEHNKITVVKEDQSTEHKQQQILKKHLEEVKKGTDSLAKKCKALTNQNNSKKNRKVHLDEDSIKREIAELSNTIQKKKKTLGDLLQRKEVLCPQSLFAQLLKKRDELQQECSKSSVIEGQHWNLTKQKHNLEERINFLENVGSSFVDSKKALLKELAQQIMELQAQREEQKNQQKENEALLLQVENRYREQLAQLKKGGKKKKETKVRKEQEADKADKTDGVHEKQTSFREEKQVYRWKGRELKKKCCVLFTLLSILGLLLSSVSGLLQ